MPSVQWFPGHMHAAQKKILSALKNVDLILELLDARCPLASQNPMIAQFLKNRQKPILKLLNKADLADSNQNQLWCDFFNQLPQTRAILTNAHHPKDVLNALKVAKTLAPHRSSALKPLRMMVLGVPNVGKSTFLNALAKRKIAQTGDVPALTRAIQRIDVSPSLILLDTPGLMWHKIETSEAGFCLSCINTIGVNAFDVMETALFLADFLKKNHRLVFSKRYAFDVDINDSADGILEKIAQSRLAKQKGGILDIEKAAHILLLDFKTLALGKISLESPPTCEN